jgi:hypothetical protein
MRPREGRRRWPLGLLLAAVWLLAAWAAAADRSAGEAEKPHAAPADAPPGVDDARATLQEWVKIRRLISQEQRDWTLGKQVLNERIELVGREIESLRGKVREAEASITAADKARAGLMEENEKLKQAAGSLAAAVTTLEASTKGLLRRLPDPIRERVKPLSQRIPEDPNDTKLSLSLRFQNIVGILNEVNKFNREITVTSEVRALPDGTSAEVTAMYVGLGQAYYVGAGGQVAGIGTASADAWVWTPANDAAPAIARAIAILKNEQVASFVGLPIKVD